MPHAPPPEDEIDVEELEPAAGTPATPPPAATTTTTTTVSTTTTNPAPSQKVVEVPAQPPALTPETGPPAVPATAAPGAPPGQNFPAIGGPPPATPGTPAPGTGNSASGSVTGTAAAPVSPLPQTAKPAGPDTYYDTATPPPGMEAVVGPRKANPVEEPAIKFIIVNKNEGAQGINAQLASASRALKLGHYDAAASMFETLYNKNPRDPRILMGRAVALQNTGKSDAALKVYDELLNVDHNNTEALVNMLGLLRKQYPEVALRRLMKLHDKYPDNATIAAQIGVAAADQGRLEDALRFLGIATSIEPNNAQHQFNLAVVLDRAGKKDDALKYYEQALENDAVYGSSRSVPREQIYDRMSVLRQR